MQRNLFKKSILFGILILAAVFFAGCSRGGGSEGERETEAAFTVTYNANGADSGTVPVDGTSYAGEATVTVLGNIGSLVKAGFNFAGWNTKDDGTGNTYQENETFVISEDTILYAKWTVQGSGLFTVTYNANGADSGTIPVDGTFYAGGATVTVFGNTGSLKKSDINISFACWNTKADGTGKRFAAGDTFVITEDTVLYAKWGEPFLTFESGDSFSINTYTTKKNWNGTLEYSTNKETWTEWNGELISSGAANAIYLRGTGNKYITGSYDSSKRFVFSVEEGKTVSCRGNIENLLDYEKVKAGIHPVMGNYCCSYMFSNCSSLVTAPELPATALTNYCYSFMFSNCSSLVTAPELPATALANYCYTRMFLNCDILVTAPELPATTLADWCYSYMFYGCSSLVNAPKLPAAILAFKCYYSMFNGCSSLTKAPELPATTLAEYCYSSMFSECSSLDTAPKLPATTLTNYCYENMFSGCSSLVTAPKLSATTLANYCYSYMFSGCSSLVTAPELPATTLEYGCYRNMFERCSSLKTAPELSATTLADWCYREMFSGCNSLVNAPELPATTLAVHCYGLMFYYCSILTNAPELPATTLADRCYMYMFMGCSNLNYIKMMATDISATECLLGWVSGVASDGTFVKNASATWNETGSSGIPEGWTVQTE